MPDFHAPLNLIDKTEVRRYAGLRGETAFPDDIVERACNEALVLVKPRGCWQNYRYDPINGIIQGQTPIPLCDKSILHHLASVAEIAVLAVTIGPDLEEAVSASFAAGDYTFGLLLDAAGTTAVEATANAVNSLITDHASRRGLSSLFRFSPGYGDWNITDQPNILSLAGGENLNIRVTPSCMLLPRKSVTAVVGLPAARGARGEDMASECVPDGCRTCSQPSCQARKENP